MTEIKRAGAAAADYIVGKKSTLTLIFHTFRDEEFNFERICSTLLRRGFIVCFQPRGCK